MKYINKQCLIIAKQKKITQKNLAKVMGISTTALSRYFSDQADIPSTAFLKMLNVLGY